VRRKKLAQARAAIVRARCRLGRVRLAPSSRAMRGRVIRQKPVPGKTLAAGARVSLVVGRG
jgi:beta-lactam-binding protein with PASTA domain